MSSCVEMTEIISHNQHQPNLKGITMRHLSTTERKLLILDTRLLIVLKYPEISEENLDYLLAPSRETRLPTSMVESLSSIILSSNPNLSIKMVRLIALYGTKRFIRQNVVICDDGRLYIFKEFESLVSVLNAGSLEAMANAHTGNTVTPLHLVPDRKVVRRAAITTSPLYEMFTRKPKPDDDNNKGDEDE